MTQQNCIRVHYCSFLYFLGTCTKLRKATSSFVMSVCPSVLSEHFGSHWVDFCETSEYFLKICRENKTFIKI
jgi:hypothetical protein